MVTSAPLYPPEDSIAFSMDVCDVDPGRLAAATVVSDDEASFVCTTLASSSLPNSNFEGLNP